jgi:hypothetical protein
VVAVDRDRYATGRADEIRAATEQPFDLSAGLRETSCEPFTRPLKLLGIN